MYHNKIWRDMKQNNYTVSQKSIPDIFKL